MFIGTGFKVTRTVDYQRPILVYQELYYIEEQTHISFICKHTIIPIWVQLEIRHGFLCFKRPKRITPFQFKPCTVFSVPMGKFCVR